MSTNETPAMAAEAKGAPLAFLIAEAVALAGGNICVHGHDWQSNAGRRCPYNAESCSQAVYQCARCGTYDYGERGGPGFTDCEHGACSSEARNRAHTIDRWNQRRAARKSTGAKTP